MLVLTRKAGQSIRIGDSIVIKIVSVDGSQVKIGIEAPKGIAIFREELYEKLRESNIEAVTTAKELKLDELIFNSETSLKKTEVYQSKETENDNP
ncbi:carbon storage regulator CsrA [Thermodesulfovibrio sp.]|uniref:carbon storage regulator CsrA n=1 Tax=Thermodesulfovibrio sp. TaxID=2067987 RepID=UPI00309BEB85